MSYVCSNMQIFQYAAILYNTHAVWFSIRSCATPLGMSRREPCTRYMHVAVGRTESEATGPPKKHDQPCVCCLALNRH